MGNTDDLETKYKGGAISDFVENYVFKYLDKINGNIDEYTDSLGITVDAYIDLFKNRFMNTWQESYDRFFNFLNLNS